MASFNEMLEEISSKELQKIVEDKRLLETAEKNTFQIKKSHDLILKLRDFKNEKFQSNDEFQNELLNAYRAFSAMKRNLRNVVRTYDFFYDSKHSLFGYSMENFQGGNLYNFFMQKGDFCVKEYIPLFRDLVAG